MNMNRRVVVSVLVAVFMLASLASPAIAQATSDAVLILHFDEGSGTVTKDASGHGNDGTVYGATWVDGKYGKALSFDGMNDYVDVGNPSFLSNTAGSISFWVNPLKARNGATPTPFGVSDFSVSNRFILMYMRQGGTGWYNDRLDIVHYDNGRYSYSLYTPEDSFLADNWYHVAVTSDGNTISIYINGVKQTLYNEIGSNNGNWFGDLTGANKFTIGALVHNNGEIHGSVNGIIDEVAIYNRALSPEEIKAHYLSKRAGGSTKDSTPDLIDSVLTRVDALKRDNIDTSLIEQSLTNAQDAYDSGNHDEAYELAQNAQKMADDAYEAQQDIESAESEIDGAKSIGADVKDAEAKLKEAKEALDKGNYEYARNWAADASELAKHTSICSVQIKDLKALATKYDQRTVVISGTIRDIETVYGEGYTFALDDGSGMISVVYQGSLGDIRDGDKVTASGIFQASTGTVVADNVEKSGVGGGVPGFEAIFAIAGLLAVAYLLRRRG